MRRSVAATFADPVVEFATLEIDGKVYRLSYDFNAIAEAEQEAKCNLLHGIAMLAMHGLNAAQYRGLLYAGLRMAHPRITIRDAGRMLHDPDNLPVVRKALIEAWNLSMPEEKKIAEDPTGGEGGNAPAD